MDGTGRFVIGWQGVDGSNNGDVYGQVYDLQDRS